MLSLTKQTAKELFETRLRPRLIIKDNGCWQVPLKHNGNGYIYIRIRSLGLRIGTHVLAFRAFNDEEPEFVLHKCDNPSCCNPNHLFSGIQNDNIKDMDRKGRRGVWRHPKGMPNPSKQKNVRKILRELAKKRTRTEIGTFALEIK